MSKIVEDLINIIRARIGSVDENKEHMERIGIDGAVEILHLRKGEVVDRRDFHNLVVSAGKAEVAGLMNGVTTGPFTYIAIGTGVAAAAAADTALGAEITTGGGARASATCTRVTTTVTNDTAQLVLTFNLTATFAVTESGCFDAATAGVLLCRQVFSALNVVSGDSLQITWKIAVS